LDQHFPERQAEKMTYLALDVHKSTSTVAYLNPADGQVKTRRIHTLRPELAKLLADFPRPWSVALEATRQAPAVCAWLRELDAEIHLLDPQKLAALAALRAAKTDAKEAELMLEALGHGYLPEAYLAAPPVQQARELMRCYQALRRISTLLRNLLRALLARAGFDLAASDLCGQGAQETLDQAQDRLAPLGQIICALYRSLLVQAERALTALKQQVRARAAESALAQALIAQPGQGALPSRGLLAEIGDLTRFPGYKQLISYAGLAPNTYQSGDRTQTGRLPQRCNRRLRYWAVVAAQCATRSAVRLRRSRLEARDSAAKRAYRRVRYRHGPNAAKIAAAREILRDVYFTARRLPLAEAALAA
jgi:transposase